MHIAAKFGRVFQLTDVQCSLIFRCIVDKISEFGCGILPAETFPGTICVRQDREFLSEARYFRGNVVIIGVFFGDLSSGLKFSVIEQDGSSFEILAGINLSRVQCQHIGRNLYSAGLVAGPGNVADLFDTIGDSGGEQCGTHRFGTACKIGSDFFFRSNLPKNLQIFIIQKLYVVFIAYCIGLKGNFD
ncbi:MAG TPA: hypothetical protein PK054_07300 [Anaerohalosphaeraceae bacterium]|nr:hypothetical protein [Anaerohalosphaeraceae bacterium]HPP56372.1 hypothetical protein [Anaerohalosphaeraceae bacterium]